MYSESFLTGYDEIRTHLAQRMEAMKAGGTAVESESYAVDESDGLYIDSYYLPTGGEKTNLIVLTTGVHGLLLSPCGEHEER